MKDRISEAWTITHIWMIHPHLGPLRLNSFGRENSPWQTWHGFFTPRICECRSSSWGQNLQPGFARCLFSRRGGVVILWVGCGWFWGDGAGGFSNDIGRTHRFFWENVVRFLASISGSKAGVPFWEGRGFGNFNGGTKNYYAQMGVSLNGGTAKTPQNDHF